MRVQNFLTDENVDFEAIHHAPAYSAQKRAKHLHVPGAQVAKCVLLATPEGYLLALLPATHHVDVDLLERQLRQPVRFAKDEEIDQLFADCEWGVVPPFGRLYGIPTILDELLCQVEMIVVEGHLHVQAIRMRRVDFERLEKPRRLCFAVASRQG